MKQNANKLPVISVNINRDQPRGGHWRDRASDVAGDFEITKPLANLNPTWLFTLDVTPYHHQASAERDVHTAFRCSASRRMAERPNTSTTRPITRSGTPTTTLP
jgi:hypothetical protein